MEENTSMSMVNERVIAEKVIEELIMWFGKVAMDHPDVMESFTEMVDRIKKLYNENGFDADSPWSFSKPIESIDDETITEIVNRVVEKMMNEETMKITKKMNK